MKIHRENEGQLVIIKTFIGVPDGADLSGLKFTIAGPSFMNQPLEITYADFENGRYTLPNDTIRHLAVGTYTVTEDRQTAETLLKKEGEAIQYTLDAANSVMAGSAVVAISTDGSAPETIHLTNRYERDTGNLIITKTFSGTPEGADLNGLTFEITGPDGYNKVISYADFRNGSYRIEDLPLGNYTVTETNAGTLIAGYTLAADSTTSGSAMVVKREEAMVSLVNKYTHGTGELTITKAITGGDNVDFSNLEFQIYGPNGYEEKLKYSQFTNGTYTLKDLPIGEYVVYETNAGFISPQINLLASSKTAMKASIIRDGNTNVRLENNYEPALTSRMVIKIWDDMDNLDGSRPGEIVMTLSNGRTVTLNAGNNWMAEITDLPLYDANGNVISYTWSEPPVPGYVQANVTTLSNTMVFTNRHMPDLTSSSVTKIWDDSNNAAGLRPATLRVTLSNGRSYTLSAANNWTVKVDNLPKYFNGQEIRYTWSEQTVLGYTQEIRVVDDVTIFTNHYSLTPPPGPPRQPGEPGQPEQPGQPRLPGTPVYIFEDYNTPLGVEVIINHVGDCFD